MKRMGFVAWASDRLGSEEGATAIEYALMVALIAMIVLAAVALLGQSTNDLYQNDTLLTGLS